MLGFTKKRLGKRREICWCGKKIFAYEHAPSSQELRDKTLQKALESAFWTATHPKASQARCEAIVSLTTFGKRAHSVHITLQSILEQSVQPIRIILWLDQNEFNDQNLPRGIARAKACGIEIDFCDNLKSYKKIIPTLEKYPNTNVVTIDDDVMYPREFLAGLKKTSERFPQAVVAYRAHQMCFDTENNILPYRQWQRCVKNTPPGSRIFPTGAGGVWYPAGCFHEQVLDKTSFLRDCATADDIWLKAMTLKNGVPCVVVPGDHIWSDLPPFIAGTQQSCLAMQNVDTDNDLQLRRVFDRFGLWQALHKTE